MNGGRVGAAEVLVWNNDLNFDGAHLNAWVIDSHRNCGPQSRFAAALVAASDLILFQDNDVEVRPATLEHMAREAEALPGDCILSLEGRRLGPTGGYIDSLYICGDTLQRPAQIDVSLGRVELVRKRTVLHLLHQMPFDDAMVMDDIWFSAAAAQQGVPRFVVPWQGDQGFTNLSECGVGLYDSDPACHYDTRDRLCRKLFGCAHESRT